MHRGTLGLWLTPGVYYINPSVSAVLALNSPIFAPSQLTNLVCWFIFDTISLIAYPSAGGGMIFF
jgi:hypothetical protein